MDPRTMCTIKYSGESSCRIVTRVYCRCSVASRHEKSPPHPGCPCPFRLTQSSSRRAGDVHLDHDAERERERERERRFLGKSTTSARGKSGNFSYIVFRVHILSASSSLVRTVLEFPTDLYFVYAIVVGVYRCSMISRCFHVANDIVRFYVYRHVVTTVCVCTISCDSQRGAFSRFSGPNQVFSKKKKKGNFSRSPVTRIHL